MTESIISPMSKICIVVVFSFTSLIANAQSTPSQKRSNKICGPKHIDQCFIDLARDQVGIWSSPFRVQSRDAIWLIPFAGATGAAIYYDADAQQQLGINQNRIDTGNSISRFGSPYATVGAGVGLYALGFFSKNEKLSETGRLGAEAVIDASIVAEAVKLAANRQRPFQGDGTGKFWPHGTKQYDLDSSFPSGHAAASWALARVIASEYPGIIPKLAAYGFATTISVARVTSRNHFPSDVLVGSTFGYLIGGYVYRHHNAESAENYTFLLTPEFNQASHTYGARLELPASALAHPHRTLREAVR
jgi:membrane-associated phospholipid phosphatase